MKSLEELEKFRKDHSEILSQHQKLVRDFNQEKIESLVGKWLVIQEGLGNEKTFILVLKPKGLGSYAFTYELDFKGIEYNERKAEQLLSLKEANKEDLEKAIKVLEKKISYIKEGSFSDIKKDLGIS